MAQCHGGVTQVLRTMTICTRSTVMVFLLSVATACSGSTCGARASRVGGWSGITSVMGSRSLLGFVPSVRHVGRLKQQRRAVVLGSSAGGRVSNAVRDGELLEKTSGGGQAERLNTAPPKGTRDFYPDDMRLRNWLFGLWREAAAAHCFVEYDAPVLESEALYTRKAGEEVVQQLYNFVDKGERAVALRPEMTPSLARMVMAKKGALPLPLKWFSIPQCWRYERMTRGRRREHYQWNMDVWGVPSLNAEAELISAMVHFFRSVGLTPADVGIKFNSRLVIAEVLTSLGIPTDKFAATCVLVDKLEKLPVDAIQGELELLGLDRQVVTRLLEVLGSKSLDALALALGPESAAVRQLSALTSLCHSYGLDEWITLDASIVRGLAYYTGVVFEAFDRKGVLRAIAGGGRYDHLLERTFGGEPTPAVGFGFGDAVIVELLQDRSLLPSFHKPDDIHCIVYAMAPELHPVAVRIATALRRPLQSPHSKPMLNVDLILDDNKKTKWVLKHADRVGAKYCVIVATKEYEDGQQVAVKDLTNGQQTTIPADDVRQYIQEYGQI